MPQDFFSQSLGINRSRSAAPAGPLETPAKPKPKKPALPAQPKTAAQSKFQKSDAPSVGRPTFRPTTPAPASSAGGVGIREGAGGEYLGRSAAGEKTKGSVVDIDAKQNAPKRLDISPYAGTAPQQWEGKGINNLNVAPISDPIGFDPKAMARNLGTFNPQTKLYETPDVNLTGKARASYMAARSKEAGARLDAPYTPPQQGDETPFWDKAEPAHIQFYDQMKRREEESYKASLAEARQMPLAKKFPGITDRLASPDVPNPQALRSLSFNTWGRDPENEREEAINIVGSLSTLAGGAALAAPKIAAQLGTRGLASSPMAIRALTGGLLGGTRSVLANVNPVTAGKRTLGEAGSDVAGSIASDAIGAVIPGGTSAFGRAGLGAAGAAAGQSVYNLVADRPLFENTLQSGAIGAGLGYVHIGGEAPPRPVPDQTAALNAPYQKFFQEKAALQQPVEGASAFAGEASRRAQQAQTSRSARPPGYYGNKPGLPAGPIASEPSLKGSALDFGPIAAAAESQPNRFNVEPMFKTAEYPPQARRPAEAFKTQQGELEPFAAPTQEIGSPVRPELPAPTRSNDSVFFSSRQGSPESQSPFARTQEMASPEAPEGPLDFDEWARRWGKGLTDAPPPQDALTPPVDVTERMSFPSAAERAAKQKASLAPGEGVGNKLAPGRPRASSETPPTGTPTEGTPAAIKPQVATGQFSFGGVTPAARAPKPGAVLPSEAAAVEGAAPVKRPAGPLDAQADVDALGALLYKMRGTAPEAPASTAAAPAELTPEQAARKSERGRAVTIASHIRAKYKSAQDFATDIRNKWMANRNDPEVQAAREMLKAAGYSENKQGYGPGGPDNGALKGLYNANRGASKGLAKVPPAESPMSLTELGNHLKMGTLTEGEVPKGGRPAKTPPAVSESPAVKEKPLPGAAVKREFGAPEGMELPNAMSEAEQRAYRRFQEASKGKSGAALEKLKKDYKQVIEKIREQGPDLTGKTEPPAGPLPPKPEASPVEKPSAPKTEAVPKPVKEPVVKGDIQAQAAKAAEEAAAARRKANELSVTPESGRFTFAQENAKQNAKIAAREAETRARALAEKAAAAPKKESAAKPAGRSQEAIQADLDKLGQDRSARIKEVTDATRPGAERDRNIELIKKQFKSDERRLNDEYAAAEKSGRKKGVPPAPPRSEAMKPEPPLGAEEPAKTVFDERNELQASKRKISPSDPNLKEKTAAIDEKIDALNMRQAAERKQPSARAEKKLNAIDSARETLKAAEKEFKDATAKGLPYNSPEMEAIRKRRMDAVKGLNEARARSEGGFAPTGGARPGSALPGPEAASAAAAEKLTKGVEKVKQFFGFDKSESGKLAKQVNDAIVEKQDFEPTGKQIAGHFKMDPLASTSVAGRNLTSATAKAVIDAVTEMSAKGARKGIVEGAKEWKDVFFSNKAHENEVNFYKGWEGARREIYSKHADTETGRASAQREFLKNRMELGFNEADVFKSERYRQLREGIRKAGYDPDSGVGKEALLKSWALPSERVKSTLAKADRWYRGFVFNKFLKGTEAIPRQTAIRRVIDAEASYAAADAGGSEKVYRETLQDIEDRYAGKNLPTREREIAADMRLARALMMGDETAFMHESGLSRWWSKTLNKGYEGYFKPKKDASGNLVELTPRQKFTNAALHGLAFGGDYSVRYVKATFNVLSYALRATPLVGGATETALRTGEVVMLGKRAKPNAGLYEAYRQGVKDRPDLERGIKRAAKAGMLNLALWGIGYAARDYIDEPEDYIPGDYSGTANIDKRKTLQRQGNSIHIPGIGSISYDAAMPLIAPVLMGAAMGKAHDRGENPWTEGLGAYYKSVISANPYVQMTLETARSFQNPAGAAKGFAENLGSRLVPTPIKTAARLTDRDEQGRAVIRNPEGLVEGIQANIPGARKDIRPALDSYGKPRTEPPFSVLDPLKLSGESKAAFPEAKELDRLNLGMSKSKRGEDETAEEFAERQKDEGKIYEGNTKWILAPTLPDDKGKQQPNPNYEFMQTLDSNEALPQIGMTGDEMRKEILSRARRRDKPTFNAAASIFADIWVDKMTEKVRKDVTGKMKKQYGAVLEYMTKQPEQGETQ